MKTKLIFVRHGFSESNRNNTFTGQADAPLADLGHFQAQRAAEFLKNSHIDKIYSSPLSRAYDTGVPIAKSRGLEIITDSGLMEINSGQWELMTFEKIAKQFPEEYHLWIYDLYSCQTPDGESGRDFANRVKATVTKIATENQGKTICITTHATPIRVISCLALGLPFENLKDVPWSPNASINIIDFEDGKFTFDQRDITKHLEGLETNLPKNI